MFTAACRYAADNGYILVCPAAENSFYHDMAYGPPWYTIISELLPQQLQQIFKIPTAREVNYIAGLSMGGYGAMRIGLSHPERYAAIGSFSGCLDLAMMARASLTPGAPPVLLPVLGPQFELPPEADCLILAAQVAKLPKAEQPRILCTCGLQDTNLPFVLEQTRRFYKTALEARLDVHALEWDGVHEWNFWDRSLAEFIGFAQNNDYGKRKQTDWAHPTCQAD